MIAQKAPLVKCNDKSQLDCIDSVYIKHNDGTIDLATYVTTRLVDFPSENNQPVKYGDILFDFHSGTTSGPLKRLRISTNVITPTSTFNGKRAGAYWIVLQREQLPGDKDSIVQGEECSKSKPLGCLTYPALNTDDVFHIFLRTSWLHPLASYGVGSNFSLDYRTIPNGMEWHFSGSEVLQPIFKDGSKLSMSATPEGSNLIPDALSPTLYFVIDHAGKDLTDSYWNPACAKYGFTRTMSNAPMAGQLFWNYTTNSLNFNVYAPHLNTVQEQNLGVFYTKFQKAWLDCLFPNNNLSTATKVEVQVLNQDGQAQVATSSVSLRGGMIEIAVSGFHYSAPTIRTSRSKDSGMVESPEVLYSDDWSNDFRTTFDNKKTSSKELPNSAQSGKPQAAKQKTIICVKGKTSKKITGTNPACPLGFKKQ